MQERGEPELVSPGIGKNNVQYRVKRLLEDGVIKKFVTQFSLGTLGLFLGKFYIQLSGFTPEKEKDMYDFLHQGIYFLSSVISILTWMTSAIF